MGPEDTLPPSSAGVLPPVLAAGVLDELFEHATSPTSRTSAIASAKSDFSDFFMVLLLLIVLRAALDSARETVPENKFHSFFLGTNVSTL